MPTVTPRSSLYVGSVMHRRLSPRPHRFRYRAFWFLLDLDELAGLSNRLRCFSYKGPNLFSFRDADHGDGTATPLRAQIERQLAAMGIDLARGRILLLCMPRTLGYCFNPLSVFFCYREDGALAAMVYQVHNTFAQRHSYVIPVDEKGEALRQRCGKRFYVSPFLDMDMQYQFRIAGPDDRIIVSIRVGSPAHAVLTAVMKGVRRDLTDGNLLRVFLGVPAVTLKVIVAIHWEALRLWAKRMQLYRRPPPPAQPETFVTSRSAVSD